MMNAEQLPFFSFMLFVIFAILIIKCALGKWNYEQMVGCYLSYLPREFMRVMAGHPKHKGYVIFCLGNFSSMD